MQDLVLEGSRIFVNEMGHEAKTIEIMIKSLRAGARDLLTGLWTRDFAYSMCHSSMRI